MSDSAQHIMANFARIILSFLSGSIPDAEEDSTGIDGSPHNTNVLQAQEDKRRQAAISCFDETHDAYMVELLLDKASPSPSSGHDVDKEGEKKTPNQAHHELTSIETQVQAPSKKRQQHNSPWTRDDISWMCAMAQKWSDVGMKRWKICQLLATYRPEHTTNFARFNFRPGHPSWYGGCHQLPFKCVRGMPVRPKKIGGS